MPARNARGIATSLFATVLSIATLLASPAQAYTPPGLTHRVSVASDGSEGFRGFNAYVLATSGDGRFVAFSSWSDNLVPGDTNNLIDVFVHDRATRVTERVSVASDGTQLNAWSDWPSISADGRFVAFHTNCAGAPGCGAGVFVHDRVTGVTEQAKGGGRADVSDDGRFVAYWNLRNDVFVHDLATGVTDRVSVATDGARGGGTSHSPSISADGRFVAFWSASTLVPGDTNLAYDVFVHDRATRVTERVSVASDGAEANTSTLFDPVIHPPSISADGRFVAFYSDASNLVPGDTNAIDVFVHDRTTGVTDRVSVASDGAEAAGSCTGPSISAHGRFVGFWCDSYASNLVAGDTNAAGDSFVHDRVTGVTERVSVASDGAEGNAGSGLSAISADGRFAVFGSNASNLVPNDTNEELDVFVRDRGASPGVANLQASPNGDEVTVTGSARFPGSVLSEASDREDDGGVSARPLGAELTGASLVLRPEEEDLLIRFDLASVPAALGGGAPGILYSLSFTSDGQPFEVRALRTAAMAWPPSPSPYFALYRGGVETDRLTGAIGTTGDQVLVSVPLRLLPQGGLEFISASTAIDQAWRATVQFVDDVSLPRADIPAPRVDLAVTPDGTAENEVIFDNVAEISQGGWSAEVSTASLSPGNYRVWARACLAESCGTNSVKLRL